MVLLCSVCHLLHLVEIGYTLNYIPVI
jgi:hypothetical protein